MPRLPVVGVIGSGSAEHVDRAEPLGRWLAEANVHLLTGGGAGVMQSVSRAFCGVGGRYGKSIGVLPGATAGSERRSPPGYPNAWIEIPIYTHLPLSGVRGTEPMSRNHLNILSSDVVVALPGSSGTSSEVRLAQRYRTPLISFLRRKDEIPELPQGTIVASELCEIQSFILTHLPGGSAT